VYYGHYTALHHHQIEFIVIIGLTTVSAWLLRECWQPDTRLNGSPLLLLWECWSKILKSQCRMPFLTQPKFQEGKLGTRFLAGPYLWCKHQLARQREQSTAYSTAQWPLISQLASTVYRPSLQSATYWWTENCAFS